jgi:hypothetical protein
VFTHPENKTRVERVLSQSIKSKIVLEESNSITISESKGNVMKMGPSKDIVDLYFSQDLKYQTEINIARDPDNWVNLVKANITNSKGEIQQHFDLSESFNIEMTIEITAESEHSLIAGFHIYTGDGTLLFPANKRFITMNEKSKGIHNITCTIPKNLLNTGVHYFTLGCSSWEPFNQFHFVKEEILGFEVTEIVAKRNDGYFGEFPGAIRVNLDIEHTKIE